MFRPRLRPVWAKIGPATTMGRLPGLFVGLKATPVRSIRTLAQLDFDDGVPGLLSQHGFDTAYTRYQQMQIDELNTELSGTALEDTLPKELVIKLSREPAMAPLFNAASMSHNNQFFFESIANRPVPDKAHRGLPPPLQQVQPISIPEHFQTVLKENFSSVESFREHLIGTAVGMFGPGFVWLVKTHAGRLRILATYLAGTPYAQAHFKKQGFDSNTMGSPRDVQDAASQFESPADSVNVAPGGIEITPILCINTWEHVWLPDYGIYDPADPIPSGKERYAVKWWDVINWDVVADRYSSVYSTAARGIRI